MSWIDADVLIKDLRADIDVYRGRGSYVYTDGITAFGGLVGASCGGRAH